MLKKCSKSEASTLKALMSDGMKPHVPEFRKELETDGECMSFLVSQILQLLFLKQGILKCRTF